MKFKTLAVAATLALSGLGASAASRVFDSLGVSYFSNNSFSGIGTGQSFTQSMSFDSLTAGVYNTLGDISGTNLSFTSVTLNGRAWDLYPDSKGKFRFGDITVIEPTPFTPFRYTQVPCA